MIRKMFSTPIVCKNKTDWFVFFRYWNAKELKYQSFKLREKLNYIHNLPEKEAEFKALCEARTIWLRQGWNPIEDPKFQKQHVVILQQELKSAQKWTVEFALKHALKNKSLAERSRLEYSKSVEYFIQSAKHFYIHICEINELDKTQIKAVFSRLKNEMALSNKNYNKRLCHIKSLLTELKEWGAINHENPAFGIKDLTEEETQKFIPPTLEEKQMIDAYLKIKNQYFYVYCMIVYYTGLRPAEISCISPKDINFEKGKLRLNPISNTVKNKKERYVVVNKILLKLLLYIKNSDCRYIFSKGFEPGNEFYRSRNATNFWNRFIREELGLDLYLYSLKHAGADAIIEAGADENTIVDHLGHSNRFVSRRYTKKGIERSQDFVRELNISFTND